MMVAAAGVSTCGYIPFASTFAMFAAGRAYEQIRNSIGYPHLNVKESARPMPVFPSVRMVRPTSAMRTSP